MKIWDISRTLTDDLAPWPGDTPFHFELTACLGENSVVNVGAIRMSVHNGSHVDAPFHFEKNGLTIDQAALDSYIGEAVVIDLTGRFEEQRSEPWITIEHLGEFAAQLTQTSRLLLKTGVWPDNSVFPERFPAIAADVADWLQSKTVRLIGLDF